jgi:hypothetical protein
MSNRPESHWLKTILIAAALPALGAVLIAVARLYAWSLDQDWTKVLSVGWTDKLANWLVAIGTIGAVLVALFQGRGQHVEAASRIYFEQALNTLRTAVQDFANTTDGAGRPRNDRRHWINFARGVGTARALAEKIKTPELRELWTKSEHYWRERTYDQLNPLWVSFPAEYYGYVGAEQIKNFATSPGERAALSESSLAFVYRWIRWPEDLPDVLDKAAKFTEDELVKMELFGPRGLAEHIRNLRQGPPVANPANPTGGA